MARAPNGIKRPVYSERHSAIDRPRMKEHRGVKANDARTLTAQGGQYLAG